jgi:putative transposase
MVSEYRSKSLTERHKHTMALDQSALLDLLGQLKLTDVSDRIRAAAETLYQQLIEAEATAFIGAAPFERSEARTTELPRSSRTVGPLKMGVY